LCHRIDVHRRTDRYRRGTSQQRQWDGDGEQNRIDGANPMSAYSDDSVHPVRRFRTRASEAA